MPTTLSARTESISLQAAELYGWGGGAGVHSVVARAERVEAARAALTAAPGAGVIARGMGRSYGDAAQLADGLVIDMTGMTGYELDRRRGVVTAQAGITIGQLLGELVPAGWVLPVLPGTQHVTVGGAIACDIHGKSHAVDGTFGRHIEAVGLLTASGEVLELEPGSALFAATVGGMGLTGVILWARLALARVGSALLSVDTDRAADLDEVLSSLAAPGGRYRVAWVDLLGRRPGRGVVTRADHLRAGASDGATVPSRAAVPSWWPSGLLRPSTVGAFNELRFRRSPRRRRAAIERLGAHMFPLDALEHWPRLYGPSGFLQYQFVVPLGSERVLELVIAELRRARVPCYLAVLKDFGPESEAYLSFPLRGWTLALDLPRAAPGLGDVLDRLDELVASAGGRVYLAKDARLRPEALQAMYPRLEQWRAVREQADPDGLWRSDLGLRTGLLGSG
jgi:decaprenylphospho-beta-D-ribofuranose 2-oxidase